MKIANSVDLRFPGNPSSSKYEKFLQPFNQDLLGLSTVQCSARSKFQPHLDRNFCIIQRCKALFQGEDCFTFARNQGFKLMVRSWVLAFANVKVFN